MKEETEGNEDREIESQREAERERERKALCAAAMQLRVRVQRASMCANISLISGIGRIRRGRPCAGGRRGPPVALVLPWILRGWL